MLNYAGYDYSDLVKLEQGAAMAGGMFKMVMVVTLLVSALMLVGMWRVFVKAGQPGWKSLIPVYNMWVLFEIVYANGLRMVLLFVPFVNFYILFKLYIDLAKCFGKGTGFGVLMVFFPYVFLPLLRFSGVEYEG